MRSLLLAGATLLAFATFMILQSSAAGAATCANGVSARAARVPVARWW